MFDVFGALRALTKYPAVTVDDNLFRLLTKFTSLLILVFSMMVTLRQFVGDPISCTADQTFLRVIDLHCWIYSTYTVSSAYDREKGVAVAAPGVGPIQDKSDRVIHHKYYQWVCFVLFFQSLFFYLPSYIWTVAEDNHIKKVVGDLNSPVLEDDKKNNQKRLLVRYFMNNLNRHNTYAWKYIGCEVFIVIIVVLQIWFTDMFLGYEFSTYGYDVITMTADTLFIRDTVFDKVFPKTTKCDFRQFGPGGSVETHDSICVMPINTMNEKIYLVMWFYFLILLPLAFFNIFYRIATVLSNWLRLYDLRGKCQLTDKVLIGKILTKCDVGDWFVLCLLSKNIDPVIMNEFLRDLSQRLEGQENHDNPQVSISMPRNDLNPISGTRYFQESDNGHKKEGVKLAEEIVDDENFCGQQPKFRYSPPTTLFQEPWNRLHATTVPRNNSNPFRNQWYRYENERAQIVGHNPQRSAHGLVNRQFNGSRTGDLQEQNGRVDAVTHKVYHNPFFQLPERRQEEPKYANKFD